MSINRVFIVGHLGRSPELRYTPTGKATCTLSVATNRGRDDNQTADWHRVECWERTAEICAASLTKGSLVAIDGQLRYDSWEAKDGQPRRTTKVVAHLVKHVHGGRAEAGVHVGSSPVPLPTPSSPGAQTAVPAATGLDDDLPF